MLHQTHITYPSTLKRTLHTLELPAYFTPTTLYRLNVCNLECSVGAHRHRYFPVSELTCTYVPVSEMTWQNQWREMLGLPKDLLRVDEVPNPADIYCVCRSGFPFLFPLLTWTCCIPVRKAVEEDQKGKLEDHTIFSDATSSGHGLHDRIAQEIMDGVLVCMYARVHTTGLVRNLRYLATMATP